jgi:Uma2 family endonuclease
MSDPAYRLLDADEFLEIDFGPERKAELVNGLVRMMAGGTSAHARVQTNVLAYLRNRLRGTSCRPFGSDMAVRTGEHSVRYPDVSVICRDAGVQDSDKASSSAKVIVEVLSPSTADHDQRLKLPEYKSIIGLDTVVFLDPDTETVRVVQRLGPTAWKDEFFAYPVDVLLPSLDVIIPAAELFTRE